MKKPHSGRWFSGPTLAFVLILTLAVMWAGCSRRGPSASSQTLEEAPKLATAVRTADQATAFQLTAGFYQTEYDAWRWTAGRFSVLLGTPPGAARKGARLQLHFTIPEAEMVKFGSLSLDATVGGSSLGSEKYLQAGDFVYSRDLPASLFQGDSVEVRFSTDKTLAPSPAERRELGVIVARIELRSK